MLQEFLTHTNSIMENIQFRIETGKEEKSQASVDALLTWQGERLRDPVYLKPTQTDRYLRGKSNHHPSQKFGIIDFNRVKPEGSWVYQKIAYSCDYVSM